MELEPTQAEEVCHCDVKVKTSLAGCCWGEGIRDVAAGSIGVGQWQW